MEVTVMKSPPRSSNKSDENLYQESPRVGLFADQESELARTSFISINDDKYNINQNNKNLVDRCRNKNNNVELLHKEEASSLPNEKIATIPTINITEGPKQSDNGNKVGIVEEVKDSNSYNPGLILRDKKMTKPVRTRRSGKTKTSKTSPQERKTTGKSIPVKSETRKVLGEKQIRSISSYSRPTILLRSSRRRGANLGNSVNSTERISGENKIMESCKNGTDCDIGMQSIDEGSCSSTKENVQQDELGQSLVPLSLGKEKKVESTIRIRKTVPCESLSLMEKILIREHEILENMCKQVKSEDKMNDDRVLKEEEKIPGSVSTEESTKNEIVSKKRFHRRKCSEPFKNERVQTRQSRSITLLQTKHEVEHNYPQVSRTEEPILSKTEIKIEERDDGIKEDMRAEECAIIRTPDINMDAKKEEIFQDKNENENQAIAIIDIDNNNDVGDNKKRENALNFTKDSPAHEISSANKDYSKSTASSNARPFLNGASSAELMTTRYQSSRKRGLENADENPKRTLRHINVQAMPVYTSRIAAASNENKIKAAPRESPLLSQTGNKSDKLSDRNRDKAEERGESPVVIEKESQNLINNIPLHSKIDRAIDPKCSYLSNTDSEDTLSNVESVPNSPAQETWPKVKGKNLKLSNKSLKNSCGKNILHKRDTSWITDKIPACIDVSITETPCNVGLKSTRKRKRLETEISSTFKHNIKGNGSELRYYVETSENQNPSYTPGRSEKSGQNSGAGNDDLGGPQETPWLRHYERPQKTHVDTAKNAAEFEGNQENSSQLNQDLADQEKRDVEMAIKIDNNKSIAGNSHSNNSHVGNRLSLRKRGRKSSQSSNKPTVKKRGRPRKQDVENLGINSGEYKLSGSSVNRASLNGSGLTKIELERLFFKFLQDGHFRIDPGQSPIIIHDNNLYKNLSTRMQCYDPKKYYMHLHNKEAQSNSESETYPRSQPHFPTDNNDERYYPSSNATSGKHGHRLGPTNPNSRNFSKEHVGQTPLHSGMLKTCSTNANIHSYTDSEKPATNTSNYDAIEQTNSVSNYMQSGYGIGFNYHQNYYNKNANAMENNSYSNIYSGVVNTNGSMNNMNTATASTNLLSSSNNFDADLNFIINTQNQNSIPRREMDLTINNGSTVSNSSDNTLQNSPTSNINPGWNLSSENQHLDSVNGILMDLNSINSGNDPNQTINTSSGLNNVMNNQNSTMNGSNTWINRSNNMTTSRFPVSSPWHASLPTYNSYRNNGNPYCSNIFNPYAGLTGFDRSHYPYVNMNSRNGMGINNENPWMRNTFASSNEQFTFNNTSTEFWNTSPSLLQENSSNQGINLSLSTNTTLPQSRSMQLDNNSLGIGHGNELNRNIEPMKDTFVQIDTKNNDVEQSARGYGDEISLPYTLEYKNDTQDLDFNNVEMTDIDDEIDDQQNQDLSEIQDYMNQTSDNLEACVNQSYTPTESSNCEISVKLPNGREIEMSKLRQELVDFTRQYSEDQTIPTSQIQQTTEQIFI